MDKALSKAHMLISKLQKKYGFKYKSGNYLSSDLSTELISEEKVCLLKKNSITSLMTLSTCMLIHVHHVPTEDLCH